MPPPSLFCGPFQPSLEDALAGRLKESPPGFGRRVAVVTPSRRMSDRVQRLLALERGLSLLNIRFHTFHSLALEVCEASAAPMPKLVADDLFHDKAIDRILREVQKDVRLPRGLSSACRSSLRDLLEANLDPTQFQEHFPDLLKDPDQKAALEFLLTVQSRYVSDMERLDLLPLAGLEKHAARLVESGATDALQAYAEVLYYGFYDLNGAQADFFAAVSEARPTAVFFPYRKDHAAFRFVDRFYQLKLGAGGARAVHLPARTETRGLGAALDALFEPSRAGAETGGLRVINVSGARDEVWCVAKEILKLRERAEDPVAFGEIGVVARSLRDYRGPVAAVFREHGIPFSLLSPEPLMRHPAARLSFLLLSLARRDFPAAAVLDVVESPYFRMERFVRPGETADEVRADWRRLVETTGLHSGWLQWKAKAAPWAEKDLELFPQLVAEGRPGRRVAKERTKALWDFLQDLRRRLSPAAGKWADRAAAARAILEENFAPGADPSAAETDAFAGVRAALEGLAAFDLLGEEADGPLFLDALEEKLSRESLDPPEPERDSVRVLNAMDARGESFRVLFLLGLCEGVFPRQVREDPLLRDPLRALLQQPAGYWILPKMAGYDEEKLLFYHLAASASEEVVGVYARSDEEGKARVPSIYLRELCRAAGAALDGPLNARVARQPLQKLDELEPPTLLTPKEASLLNARDGAAAAPLLPKESAALLTSGLARLKPLKQEGEPHAMDGLAGRPAAYLEGLLRNGLSPTALDTFATCPFKFYAGYVLRLKDPEEPRDMSELAPALRGQIYHLIFQRFFEKLKADGYWERPAGTRGGRPVPQAGPAPGGAESAWKPALEGVIDAVFNEFGWQGLGVYPVLWRSLKDQMSDHVRRLAAFDMAELERSGFVPSYFEQFFQGPAPLEGLPGALAGLRFRGKPDRVDVRPGRPGEGRRRAEEGGSFRVIDYKSRWRRGDLEKIVPKGRAHQPPVYLEILKADPRFADLEPEGAVYYAVEEAPEVTGVDWAHPFSAGFWRSIRAAALKNMAGLVGQIERGEFFIVPDDQRNGHCKWCAFSMACRKSHARSRRRAEFSQLRAAFDALRAGVKAKTKDLLTDGGADGA